MFVLCIHQKHRVTLTRFSGVVSSEDLKRLDIALAALAAREGFVRGIFDFSTIESSAVPESFLGTYARLPQILLAQERVIVAPQQEVYDLACAYAVQQRDFGNMEPMVVRDLEHAYRLFGVDEDSGRRVCLDRNRRWISGLSAGWFRRGLIGTQGGRSPTGVTTRPRRQKIHAARAEGMSLSK